LQKVAVLYVWLSQRDRERQAYLQALAIQQQLTADFPDDPIYQRDLGKTLHHLAGLARRFGTRAEAEEAFRRVLAVREDLARRYPGNPEYRSDLAQSLLYSGVLYRGTDIKRTRELYLQALALQEAVVRERPQEAAYLGEVIVTQNSLAALDFYTNNLREAEAGFLRARDWQLRRLEVDANKEPGQGSLAGTYGNLAAVYSKTGRYPEALAAYEQALAIQTRIAAEHPDLPDLARAVGTTHKDMGILFLNQQKWDRARVALEAALDILKPIAERYPREPEYQRHVAAVHCDLAEAYENLDRWTEAFGHSRSAVAGLEQLLREHPGTLDYLETLALACIHLSNEWLVQKKTPESQAAIDRAIHLLEEIRQREPKYGLIGEVLPMAYQTRGDLRAWQGGFDAAIKDWEQAATLEGKSEEAKRQTQRVNQALRQAAQGDYRGAQALVQALRKDFAGRIEGNLTIRIAWVYMLAASAARADARLQKEEQDKLVDFYLGQAIAVLAEAQQHGYFKVSLRRRLLHLDPILAPLRKRPDYTSLQALN
jgi:tetratricopeptide (TPR) repeat protein